MISGLLLLNKPKDITSHQLVDRVRSSILQRSVGHCGTLDPMAEGLMLVVLGLACKHCLPLLFWRIKVMN